MLIDVVVHTNSKKPRIEEKSGTLHVYVRARPADGEANKELEESIASHLGVPVTSVRIIRGGQSKYKIVEVP